jgi:thiamine-phosphate pyrophosphorylase
VNRVIAGLYAVTPEGAGEEGLLQRSEQALTGGARILQYRDKSENHALRSRIATALAGLCRTYQALFIVNDDIDLASVSGAHGVHLGRDDATLVHARAALGPRAVIGASCYNDLDRAEEAVRAGADYLAFGSFYASAVKPSAVRASLDLLREARRRFDLPLVAIGGITPQNAPALLEAGADALAVVTALFEAADTRSAAQSFARLFGQRASAVSSA